MVKFRYSVTVDGHNLEEIEKVKMLLESATPPYILVERNDELFTIKMALEFETEI